jgi:tetratricopeptide (TPR) repeat protein
MGMVEKTVFISYRRTNVPWALAIFQNLTIQGFDVFFDYMGIASGDFESVILENIKARAHFLILLTPSALDRCGEPGDWLRREIEAAIENRRNIVPLMLESFDFGTPAIANQLTGKLDALKRYNALRVPVDYFMEAMNRLRNNHLNVELKAVTHPASISAQEAAKRDQTAAAAAPVVEEIELTAQQCFEQGFNATDLDEQFRYYSEAIRLKADFVEAFVNRAIVRRDKGDLGGALRDTDEAIRLNPNFIEAYFNRGSVRDDMGDADGALQDFDKAIRMKPDYGDAYNNRGVARAHKGDDDGALRDFCEAIRLKPDAYTYYNRGNARRRKGDLDGAMRDYDEAIRLRPDYGEAYNNRGVIRIDKGDLDGALRDCDEAVRLTHSYASYDSRGLARFHKSDLDGALRDFDEAIRLKPDYDEAYNNRGLARFHKGDLDGALRDYDEAIRLTPDNADVHKNRGDVRHKRGEYQAAIADYQKYLDLGGGVRDGARSEIEEKIDVLKRSALP